MLKEEQAIYDILKMWKIIFEDIFHTWNYGLYSICAALAVTALIALAAFLASCQKHSCKIKTHQWILLFFFIAYICLVAQVTYFSREAGSRGGISFLVLPNWRTNIYVMVYALENVIMAIPLGILLPLLWRRMQCLWRVMAVSCFASIFIETMQLVTARGYCQMEDVIMNTCGAGIGFGVFWLLWGRRDKLADN